MLSSGLVSRAANKALLPLFGMFCLVWSGPGKVLLEWQVRVNLEILCTSKQTNEQPTNPHPPEYRAILIFFDGQGGQGKSGGWNLLFTISKTNLRYSESKLQFKVNMSVLEHVLPSWTGHHIFSADKSMVAR